jgi:BsuBI/PstI restriction endonuclease domain/BsuBI/PstI restriction endonuclease HTH domain
MSVRVKEALKVLADLGLPRGQRNERSALTLLALLDLTPEKSWFAASAPLMGITPIMTWCRTHYGKAYAPNTRESVRRRTIHQFVQTGLATHNPDDIERSVNSEKSAYQISVEALGLLRLFGADGWDAALKSYLEQHEALAAKYAGHRDMNRVALRVTAGKTIHLSPGKHSKLIQEIVAEFAPRFAPDGALIYVGDTGAKLGYFDEAQLRELGVAIDSHGKMPDVIIYVPAKNWLLLIEAVTSHGPVDAKRHIELLSLFSKSTAGLVYVTAFPTRAAMAWETEVWVADSPSHLIHFNGDRFLGPHAAV